MKTHHAMIVSLALLTATACDGGAVVKESRGPKPDLVITMLHQGVIEEQGSPDQVFDRSRSERLRQFLSA